MNARNADIPNDIAVAIRRQLGDPIADLERSMKFGDDLGFDAMDSLELIIALEQLRGTEISDAEASGLVTIGDLVDFVEAAAVREAPSS